MSATTAVVFGSLFNLSFNLAVRALTQLQRANRFRGASAINFCRKGG